MAKPWFYKTLTKGSITKILWTARDSYFSSLLLLWPFHYLSGQSHWAGQWPAPPFLHAQRFHSNLYHEQRPTNFLLCHQQGFTSLHCESVSWLGQSHYYWINFLHQASSFDVKILLLCVNLLQLLQQHMASSLESPKDNSSTKLTTLWGFRTVFSLLRLMIPENYVYNSFCACSREVAWEHYHKFPDLQASRASTGRKLARSKKTIHHDMYWYYKFSLFSPHTHKKNVRSI